MRNGRREGCPTTETLLENQVPPPSPHPHAAPLCWQERLPGLSLAQNRTSHLSVQVPRWDFFHPGRSDWSQRKRDLKYMFTLGASDLKTDPVSSGNLTRRP